MPQIVGHAALVGNHDIVPGLYGAVRIAHVLHSTRRMPARHTAARVACTSIASGPAPDSEQVIDRRHLQHISAETAKSLAKVVAETSIPANPP